MSKREREKLRKAKPRKFKKAKTAQAKVKQSSDSNAPTRDLGTALASRPFGVDSVGRSATAGGAPRLPRRSKKG
ncbi:MAG: hypothetical protein O6933_06570 [Planctomycetota bacterium]|nr:hypothetical protein [Planctomycetota bacterium]